MVEEASAACLWEKPAISQRKEVGELERDMEASNPGSHWLRCLRVQRHTLKCLELPVAVLGAARFTKTQQGGVVVEVLGNGEE